MHSFIMGNQLRGPKSVYMMLNIVVISKIGSFMEMVSKLLTKIIYTKVSFIMVSNMENARFIFKVVTIMKVNLIKRGRRGMEYINGKMDRYMRESGKIISNLDKVLINIQMEMYIRDNGKMI